MIASAKYTQHIAMQIRNFKYWHPLLMSQIENAMHFHFQDEIIAKFDSFKNKNKNKERI